MKSKSNYCILIANFSAYYFSVWVALWKYLKPKSSKDRLPDPTGSLLAEVPS